MIKPLAQTSLRWWGQCDDRLSLRVVQAMVLAQAAPNTFNRIDNRMSILLDDGHSRVGAKVQTPPAFLSFKHAAFISVDPGGSHLQIENMVHRLQCAGRAGFYAVKLRTQEARFSVRTENRCSSGGAILLRRGEKSLLRAYFYALVTTVAKIGELLLRNSAWGAQQPHSWLKGVLLSGDGIRRVNTVSRRHELAKGSAYKIRSFNKESSAIYLLVVSHLHILHYDRSG